MGVGCSFDGTQTLTAKVRTAFLVIALLALAIGLSGCASTLEAIDSFLEPAATDTPTPGPVSVKPAATNPPTPGAEPAVPAASASPTPVAEPVEAAIEPQVSTEVVADTALQPARRPAHVQAVVSADELATAAGIEILNSGGSAADAAVAVAAVLSLVQPYYSSALGGGTWALYYDADTGTVSSLDGVGRAGSLATLADYSQRLYNRGVHNSIVPGAWDGWMLLLAEHGKLDLQEVLAPAIRLASDGHPASRELVLWLSYDPNTILSTPNLARIYAPNGSLVQVGELVYQDDMARTFLQLALAYQIARGQGHQAAIQAARDYFYRGPIAEAIVAYSEQNNGYFTLADFNNFAGAIVDPISIDYSDEITVFENPPNSQGITMLLALNILKGMDLGGDSIDDPAVVHAQVEALKLAFADRYAYIGDPEWIDIPVAQLLSDEHAQNQRARIDPNRAQSWPIDTILTELTPNNTTTFSVVDAEGNGVAVTTSLGAQFLVAGDTGIHLNERMRFFSIEEGNVNVVAPGKKVRHTSNPYLVLRNGRLFILGGSTGADTQPQAQVQQFLGIVEFGLSAQAAVTQPRFISTAFPNGRPPYQVRNTLQVESSFSAETVAALRGLGHDVVVGQGIWGEANYIVLDADGLNAQVGADPRISTSSGIVLPAPGQ